MAVVLFRNRLWSRVAG